MIPRSRGPVDTQRTSRFGAEAGAVGRNSAVVEIVWVAIVLAAILFNLVIGPLTPLTIIASIPLLCVVRWEKIPAVIGQTWPLLTLPVFVMLSVFWSDLPATTLRYAILYLLTAICGIFLGAVIAPRNLLKGLFAGFAVYSVCTLLSFRWVRWDGPGGQAFSGLAGSKNSAGDIAALACLSAIAVIFWAWRAGHRAWLIVSLGTLPLMLYALWFSKATGALIAFVLAVACLCLWTLSRRLPGQFRNLLFVVATVTIIAAVTLQSYWLPVVFDAVLAESGKDAGLTGRADLWRKADELIAVRPWLGLGYNAFWVHGNLDAEYLWRISDISSREGFNFHSTEKEVVVHLGYLGFTLYAIVAAIGSVLLLGKTMQTPTIPAIFVCCLLIFIIPKLPFEVIGFGTMHFATILLFAILAFGFRRWQTVDSRPQAAQQRAVRRASSNHRRSGS